ncbi:Nulp1-type basic helix-loop-helix domain-containing protein [Tieghemostelium lacteum]|uniref:Nulp1-type basic helix-loop-helix domain-containing protein n=1 Tax=Tieghemostelium lacteum TaxID=361077 RepID=A0A151ZE85_TIELA|nr:Nulp1-type basic helix-loop-helix domain-containing protein [Tieghemostelium lacteum]|eukprot:KYQ92272.1 Nulp1-type basic helix-loop-helix domain-containing protein [Tieghemostelium lacteum]
MSSRALRKKSGLKVQELEDDSIYSSSEDESLNTTKSTFSMLNLDEDDVDVYEEDEEEEVVENTNKETKTNTTNNKKKNKNSKKNTTTTAASTKKKNKNSNKKNSNKEIDELVKNITSTASLDQNNVVIDKKTLDFQNLFKINSANFNPDNELKKLLGCKLSEIKSVDAKKKPINVHNHPNFKKKNYIFVTPKHDWPFIMSSMVMELDKSQTTNTTTTTGGEQQQQQQQQSGIQYFKMRWGQTYRDLQEEFYELLKSHNPMSIAALLRINPYHIDSLLQLSQVCLQTADFQNAGEFVERSVFAFEVAWHHLFNPLQFHQSRFEYRHDENKSCFLSIFRYIQILGRRGCPLTALEFCKLLLLFDHKDPLFVRLIIDFYAIQSRQYRFLLDLYEKVGCITPGTSQPLDLLPNFCYSVSLAQYQVEVENGDNSHKKSSELLQKALISFPTMLKPLIDKLKTSLVVLENGKSRNLVDDQFFSTSASMSGVEHLVTLFVERNHTLWNQPAIIEWIKDTTLNVLKLVKDQPDVVDKYQVPVKKEYSTIDSEIFDHLVLSEYSDVIQRFPPDLIEMMRREGYENLAPQQVNPHDIQQHQQQQQQRRGGLGGGYQIYQQQQQRRQLQNLQQQQNAQLQEQQLQQIFMENHNQPILQDAVPHAANPLVNFIQSLMPWNGDHANTNPQIAQNAQGWLDQYIDYEEEEEEDN